MWSAGISGCTIEPEPFVFPTRTFAAVVLGLVYFLPVFSHQLRLSVAVFALALVSLPLCPPLTEACRLWSVVWLAVLASLWRTVSVYSNFFNLCVPQVFSLCSFLAPVLCVPSTFITRYGSMLYMQVCLVDFLLSKMRSHCLML